MFQNGFYVSIRKTEKREVSDDVHDLPPDNGPFEEYHVADYPGCPAEWSKDGVFIPVHESQPMWFDFRGNLESACLAAVQRINPITGETADIESGLTKNPLQNYLKLPDQLWLDGYSKEGKVYQFVVVTEGKGEAVNEVLLPKSMQDSHAMGFAFYLPKPRPVHQAYSSGNPMWFSPLHSPQSWQTSKSRGRTSSSSSSASPYKGLNKTVTTPQYSLPQNDSVVIGTSGATTRFTQNRVADNYNCVEGTTTASFDYDRASSIDSLVASDSDSDTCFLSASADDIDVSQMEQASMGAGGRIRQDIILDNNTVEHYQDKPAAILTIYLALPEMFEAITKRGKRQDASRKDKYKTSGYIGGVPVPLV